jgi:large subunit ribosomal protein L14
MIQVQTILDVADNSGIKKIKCLKILGGFQKRYGVIGSLVCGSVKKLKSNRSKSCTYKRGDLVLAVVVLTKSQILRFDGEKISFLKNSIILSNNQLRPQSTRIIKPLCSEFRKRKYIKLLSLTSPSI